MAGKTVGFILIDLNKLKSHVFKEYGFLHTEQLFLFKISFIK